MLRNICTKPLQLHFILLFYLVFFMLLHNELQPSEAVSIADSH